MASTHHREQCRLCGRAKPIREILHGDLVHGPILDLIKAGVPEWSPQDLICLDCLNHYRAEYVARAFEEERGELSALDAEVLRTLKEHELISEDPDAAFERHWTLGERVADRVAAFGGSWAFLLMFASVLVGWIAINSLVVLLRPFDPYAFILLNLGLSSALPRCRRRSS